MSVEISITQKAKGIDTCIRVTNGLVHYAFIDDNGFKVSSEFELRELGFLENRYTYKDDKKIAIYKGIIILTGITLMFLVVYIFEQNYILLFKAKGAIYYFFIYWGIILLFSLSVSKLLPRQKLVNLSGGSRYVTLRTDLPTTESVNTFIDSLKKAYYDIVMEDQLNGRELFEDTIKSKLEFLISRKVILRTEKDKLLEQLMRANEKKIGF